MKIYKFNYDCDATLASHRFAVLIRKLLKYSKKNFALTKIIFLKKKDKNISFKKFYYNFNNSRTAHEVFLTIQHEMYNSATNFF